MIVWLLAPVYVLLNIYILLRVLRYFAVVHEKLRHPIAVSLSIAAYVFLMLTPLLGYLIQAEPVHRWLKCISNYWMGFLAIGLVTIAFFDLGRVILNRTLWKDDHPNEKRYRHGATCALIIVAVVAGYGFFHFEDIKINEQTITVDKSLASGQDSLKVVLVADLHMGYSIGYDNVDRLVDEINRQDADIVVMAGDIFDNEYEALEDPEKMEKRLSEIKSRYGTYACWGNHDLPENLLAGFTVGGKDYIKDERFYEFLEKSHIKLLEDENLLIGGDFYLIGRNDPSMSEKLGEKRMTPDQLTDGLDKSKPILVIDHQPEELEELADAGADVDFSGHTHNGQIFPGNLLTALTWENPAGTVKVGDMTSCVTQGAGVWGPAMRLGTDSEIMVINIKFSKEDSI